MHRRAAILTVVLLTSFFYANSQDSLFKAIDKAIDRIELIKEPKAVVRANRCGFSLNSPSYGYMYYADSLDGQLFRVEFTQLFVNEHLIDFYYDGKQLLRANISFDESPTPFKIYFQNNRPLNDTTLNNISSSMILEQGNSYLQGFNQKREK
jgi:hypothetical protein